MTQSEKEVMALAPQHATSLMLQASSSYIWGARFKKPSYGSLKPRAPLRLATNNKSDRTN